MPPQATTGMRRFSIAAILLCLCAVATARAGEAKPSVRTEYDIKAAFLYKFALFVEWPAATFAADDSPFTVGVLGDDPFGSRLEAVVGGKKVRGRPIRFRRFTAIEQVLSAPCQLLFVSTSERDRVSRIVSALEASPILTLGDTDGYAEAGVAINLVVLDHGVKFEINPAAVKRAQLRIPSQLMDLALATKQRRPKEGVP